ncbi:MAG: hypothetical protein EA426_03590 [Spirochaetaceae bacterium]|nr:MAG: hypothetical protein EA426_03590 [Spirochaetaceae bacterium]
MSKEFTPAGAGGYLIEWFGLRGMYIFTSGSMALVVFAFVLSFVTPGWIAVPCARRSGSG